jgi:hypothetical protein
LDQTPSASEVEIAQKIGAAFTPVCAPKCPTVTVLRNSTAPNALTFVASDSMKIVYSPAFFTAITSRYGDDGIVGILAHEYGHLIDAVTVGSWMSISWTPELRADAWAGCALGKLKLNSHRLEQALTAISQYPSASRRKWDLRILPLRTGYSHCGGPVSDFDKSSATIVTATTKR